MVLEATVLGAVIPHGAAFPYAGIYPGSCLRELDGLCVAESLESKFGKDGGIAANRH
jgi:hypothetical protein